MKAALLLALAPLVAACASMPGATEGTKPMRGGLAAAAFAPDGSILVAGDSYGRLEALDPSTGRSLWSVRAHRGGVRALAFSPDGRSVASVGEDGAATMRATSDGAAAWTVPVSREAVYEYDGVAFSPDGAIVAVAGLDEDVHLFAAADGRVIRSFKTEGSTAVLFTADGRRLLAGSWSSEVAVFDPSTGIQQANWVAPDAFRGVGSGVSVLALSPDGATLAEGDEDGRVRIWETADGKLLREIEGNGAAVVGIGFDTATVIRAVFADGTIATTADGGTTGALTTSPEDRPVTAAALDPLHGRIAWGGWSGRVTITR